MKFVHRYQRNSEAVTPEETAKLGGMSVCVVGCGGLGGYIIEMLGRLGIGKITAIDGDVFDETNLNRQLLSTEELLGTPKAQAAKSRLEAVNAEVKVYPIVGFLTQENACDLIKGHDVVVDALDNIASRRVLEAACAQCGLTLIHGAIGGWHGQVCVIPPGSGVFDRLYPKEAGDNVMNNLGNLPFNAGLVASLEAAETVKYLLGKGELLEQKLLVIDLLSQEFDCFEL